MPDSPIPEELVSLLHAISGDRRLCESLLSMQQLPANLRRAELLRIGSQMRSDGVDAAVADAVFALAQPRLYEAACKTIRELYL